jgi:type IV pilus assembly protein PilW
MSGFSMIEMMISITIGLLIIVALIGVLNSAASSSKTNDRTNELQSNGRFALDHLKNELRLAKYRGYTWVTPNTSTVAITNECLVTGATAGSFVNNLSQGIWGTKGTNPYGANCLSTGYLRGDVLVIRHVSTNPLTPPATISSTDIYFRSTFVKGEMFKPAANAVATSGAPLNADGTPFGTPLADFLVNTYVYYIGSDDNNAATPALRRLSLANASMSNDEMVVSGIEQIHVEYGRTPVGGTTIQYFNADEITSSTDWLDVSSVRIWLVARHSQTEPGYTNPPPLTMGRVTYTPPNDSYTRQLFSTVVQLRNYHTD